MVHDMYLLLLRVACNVCVSVMSVSLFIFLVLVVLEMALHLAHTGFIANMSLILKL